MNDTHTFLSVFMFLCFLIPIIVVLAFTYKKITENSVINSGNNKIYDIDRSISDIPGKKVILKNVRTECEGHYGTIDTLVLHEQGLVLIYYVRTTAKTIENRYNNKWIAVGSQGIEYIPNYITQCDYDIIFLTKLLNLYKHSFRTIIALKDNSSLKYPQKPVKAICITKQKYVFTALKRFIEENIKLYNEDKIQDMSKKIEAASKEVQNKIFSFGQINS